MPRAFLMRRGGELQHTYTMSVRKTMEDKGWKLAAVIDGRDMSFMYYNRH